MNQRSSCYVVFCYAKVLFDLSQSNIDKMCNDVKVITEVIKVDKVYSFLISPIVSVDDKSAVFNAVRDYLEKVLLDFLCVVMENRRFPLLLAIFEQFFVLVKQYKKRFDVEITSPYLLSKKEVSGIIDVLKTKYGTVENIINNVNPEILGGFIVRVGFNVIDVSLNNYLQNLSEISKITICSVG